MTKGLPMSDRDVVEGDDLAEQSERTLPVPGFGPPSTVGTALVVRDEPPSREHAIRNVVLVLGGVVLVAIVVFVLIASLFLFVVRDAVDDVESGRNETAITIEQYKAIELGMREADVRSELGEPDNKTASGDDSASSTATSCLYYNERDAGLVAGDSFKFCFTGDQLVRKSVG
ncbi:MAG: hypothetical protein ACRDO7_10155 [Nocardioidaceae bacterium]